MVNHEKPPIIIIRDFKNGESVLIYPDINQTNNWFIGDNYNKFRKISVIDFLHREGYRVYHMEIDKYENLWYWRLNKE